MAYVDSREVKLEQDNLRTIIGVCLIVDQGTNGMALKVDVQCGCMKMIRARWMALILSALGALLCVIPYIVAWKLAPVETAFNGFLINPIDGFTYLAKMRQGLEGNWSLILPYAPDPGPRAFLYVYYLLLGHISRIASVEPIYIFHSARFLAGMLLFYCAYLLNEQISSHRQVRWFGFALIVLGSGLGWLSIFFESVQSSDILIPESIPFLVVYSNAHFPMAASALLIGILAALAEGWHVWKRVAIAGFSGVVLGTLLPFSFVSLLVVLGLWSLLELWNGWRMKPTRSSMKASLNIGITLVTSTLGALPWLLYDLWLSLRHPVISLWNAQNQTPSPSPFAYLLGFAPCLILGVIGYFRGKPWQTGKGRLLLVWLLSGAILLYAPVAFQRRLSLGLAFPLSILAAWGWGSIPMRVERRKPLAVVLLLFVTLTNALVVSAGLSGVARGEPAVVYLPQEDESYEWISANVAPGNLILAGEKAGNRLPAFAEVRVLYGHPFETPNSDTQVDLVQSLYREEGITLGDLHDLGINWIYYGVEERNLGQPGWLTEVKLRWEKGEIAIFEVPPA